MEEVRLDTDWINKYEEEEKYYGMFYKEGNSKIKINVLYVNRNKEMEKIEEKNIQLSEENLIKKEDFINIINKYKINDNKKYNVLSILVYNFILEHEELKNFLNNSNKYDFLKKINILDDYTLSSTINCFQELNNLYIILLEESLNKKTKRIRFNIDHTKTKKRKHK
tara:strand:+ start:1084 stop:1584 length:501 start_codon:yes stop_codon:yes gene_type:complete